MKVFLAPGLLSVLAISIVLSGSSRASRLAEDRASASPHSSSSLEPGLPAQDPRAERLWRLAAVTAPVATVDHGWAVYQANCIACHGADRKGVNSTFPSLIGVNKRYSDAQITKQIRNGKGRMLAFPYMKDEDMSALLLYLKTPATSQTPKAAAPAS